jgi:hypothetical protein
MRNKKKLYNNFTRYFIVHFSILIISVLFLAGCGKKAPPVPPRQVKLPAVNELDARIVGDTLKLTWAIPKEKEGNISGLSGFIVYRSKMLSSSDCKNRQVLLKQITDKPLGCF